jgi:DNA-binding LacI/PurR family transcriptional regulator
MTVSRAINENGYVSSDARDRILRAVKELDYHPNGLARSLKRRRTHVVGILLPDIGHPFSAELCHFVEQTLLNRGYTAFISTTQRSVEREQAALNAFFDHRLDGIIVATTRDAGGKRRDSAAGQPWCTGGHRRQSLGHPERGPDQRRSWKGGHEMVAHLAALGHSPDRIHRRFRADEFFARTLPRLP